MDLALLETFRTIAEEGSFSRAGQKLLRTQPAVSLALKRLEGELGVTLIDRTTKSLSLTDAGRLTLEYCERYDGLDRELRTALAELQDLQAGRLSIGANESTALYLLGPVVEYRRRHPRVHIEIRRSLSSGIPEELLRGRLEMGAISYDPGDERLTAREIYADHLAFVVSPRHRLAGRKELSIQELGEEVFIAHNVSGPYRRRVIETFQHHHVPLNMAIELPTIETIRRLVQLGLGVAFLPGMCVQQEIEQGALVEIPVAEMQMERTIRLVYPSQRQLSHAGQAFLEVLGL
ncbi:MAG: LysR family transcriptional regulator [Acidobacteria bacterium]|nr:LysR family transcriptional regulator [Acidobacteriota bacterium]